MRHVSDELNSFLFFFFLSNSNVFFNNSNLNGFFKIIGPFFDLYFVVNKRITYNKIRYMNSDKSSKCLV